MTNKLKKNKLELKTKNNLNKWQINKNIVALKLKTNTTKKTNQKKVKLKL